jgi:PAS domain S-box-containing protein
VGFDLEHLPEATPSLIDFMVAEDKAIVEESLAARLRGEQPVKELQEVRVIAKDGGNRIFAITTSINENLKGEAVSISGTVQDITARKGTEAKYRSLVEETSQMTFITDLEGRFTYASPRLKKVIGYDDEDIIGKQFAFIYDEEWRKNTIKFYIQQLLDNKAETEYVFPVKTKDGNKIWFEQIATLVKKDGEVRGFQCVLHDITDRVNTEQTMLEAARIATEAKEMQQNFLGKMSHEIRTPMNGVVGMVNLLRNTELSEKQRLYVDTIRESAGNLLRILNDILDLSKIEAGKMTFEETEFDLVKLVNSVILNIRPGADDKKLIVASYIDDRIPRTIVADPLRLNQVLLNLAGNALKFTERGSIVIRVELQSMNDSGMMLKFSVSDSGIGIPRDKQSSIFESFAQADTFTTRKYGGSGLGLTIARQLIEQQGGTIDLQSEEGKGTIFYFTFNCKWPEQKPAKDESYTPSVVNTAQLGSYHILLVEDNIINQMVAQHTIENWGASVTIADNGRKAMDLLRAHKYDLVLMDLQLPEISGIQTTTMIRRDLGLDVPIIAMTASAMKNERDACIAAGMNDYFSKPFEYDDLNKILHRHLAVGLKPEKEKLFDLSGLLSFVDNDVDFAREILSLFVAKMPALLQEVKTYTKDKDIMQLRSAIHSIKGTVSYFGEDEVNELLSDIEAQLRANVLTPTTVTRIDMLSQKLDRLIAEAITESQQL